MTKLTKSQIILLAGFILFSLLASKISFSPFIVGKLKFSLFDLYAPVAGGFFGPFLGIISVFIVGAANLLIDQTLNLAAILHVFPVLFGVWYFASKSKLVNTAIPAIAIIGFLASPIGREVWYYPLFWLIPIVMSFYKEKSVLANALGAAFTTHAIGGLLWIHFFAPPASVWIGLIPIVIIERAIFAAATAAVYLAVQKIKSFYAVPAYQNPPVSPA